MAGGGPGGLAAAIHAARAGMRVVLVEPRAGPIDKACGEGLMPRGVAALHALGVAPPGMPFRGIRYLDGAHVAQAAFPDGCGLGVRRVVLHEAMLRRADALGVERVTGVVEGIAQDTAGVVARLASGEQRSASWLVVADGLHSRLRAGLGLASVTRWPRRYGIRRHFQRAPWSDLVEVYWGPRGEAYVTPVGPDTVGVALLFSGKQRFDALLEDFPALRARLDDAACGDAAGAGPFARWAARRQVGRVFLVGDAAGFLDPLTGEGVRLAVEAAGAAVTCMLRNRPRDYDPLWRRMAWRYWTLTSLLLTVGRLPALRARLVGFLARWPGIMRVGLA